MHAALSLWLKVGIFMKKYHKFQRHLRSCQAFRNLFVRFFFLRVFLNRIFSSLSVCGYRNCVKTTWTFCKLGIRTSPHCNVTWHCIIPWLIATRSRWYKIKKCMEHFRYDRKLAFWWKKYPNFNVTSAATKLFVTYLHVCFYELL